MISNEELTKIYYEANGMDLDKFYPISTERIFNAMRAMKFYNVEKDIQNLIACGKCSEGGSLVKLLREL